MTNNRRRQQGNILVPVMLIGLTCTLILGALINRMTAVLWVIAILSNVTALQRVIYAYVELKRGWPRPPVAGAPP